MNKIFTGILAFLYMAFASGIVVNIHYCMGKPDSVGYAGNNSRDICSRCGMENKKGCCHNELKIVKIADDQQMAKANLSLPQTTAGLYPDIVCFTQPIQGLDHKTRITYHSPPDKKGSSRYLFACVFRI
jgi:hypothetical protein